MSVSWQNRRRGQSLVAHGRDKKQQQNNVFLKLRLNELTNGELRIFRGMVFQICGAACHSHYNNQSQLPQSSLAAATPQKQTRTIPPPV